MNNPLARAKELERTHRKAQPVRQEEKRAAYEKLPVETRTEISGVVDLCREQFGEVSYTVTVEKEMKEKRCPACGRTEIRSSEANRRYWALLHEIAENVKPKGNVYSAETWHLYFRQRFLGSNDVTLPNGKVTTQPNSTAKLEVADFSDYMEKVQVWAAEHDVSLEE